MADHAKDYLSVYKRFFDDFAKTINPDDQLPVRVAGYRLWDNEVVGETVDWTLQYLSQRNCPPGLLAPITRMVIDEVQQQIAAQPDACGFRQQDNCYLPLKLMKAVTNKVNEVCLRFCDNGRVASLPPPTPGPQISSCAVKNSRRCMEDRHVILEDFHAFFNINDASPASYYAVFDGHAGTDAAVYSVSHLHQFLAESSFYPSDPEKAIREAFLRTDNLFIEKSKKENLRSGTTAVCALLRPQEKKLYVAWLGDSQAALVRNGVATNLVYPHKPDRQDEMNRIQGMGGSVLFWGTWRVNGQLAVSRAIGDLLYKPYVTAEPDVKTIDLQGDEDYLILACDGLWDVLTPADVTRVVDDQLARNPGDLEAVSQCLVQLSKGLGSTDNITVIVAFLRDPAQLAESARLQRVEQQPRRDWLGLFDGQGQDGQRGGMDADTVTGGNATNPFDGGSDMSASAAAIKASAPALFEMPAPCPPATMPPPPYNNGHTNGTNLFDFLDHAVNATPNGKSEHRDEDEDNDSGAEVGGGGDALDPVHASLLPPAPTPLQSNNPFGDALADELLLQQQQSKDFDPEGEPARDTPTPPADEVPGVIGLVSDNVAESGEESEDEWNYYRVDHTGKSPQPPSETEQQTKPEVCLKELASQGESAEDMESQLNPNAAEFIPSPTHTRPSMEELILSQGKNDLSMEDVIVPSSSEFEKEVSMRPSEVDFENSIFNSSLSSVNTSGLVEETEKRLDELSDFSKSQREKFENPLDVGVGVLDQQESSVVLDNSAAFSTDAEFGDVSTASFTTNTAAGFEDSRGVVEDSDAADPPKEFPVEQINESAVYENNVESPDNLTFQDTVLSDYQKEPVHISFELQKEIAPHMESEPERVKVDSVDESPVESDVQITNEVPNTDNPEPVFSEDKSDLLEGFVEEPVVSEDVDNVRMPDNQNFEKTEEFVSKVAEFDLLNDFCKPLSDISQPLADIPSNFHSSIMENKLLDPGNLDEGFREDLPIQKETLNLLSHEMSTPEYEKLEKVVEASEAIMDEINMSRKETPPQLPEDIRESSDEGAVLESAHPDKTELLVDACVELPVSSNPLNMFGGSEIAQVPCDVVEEPVYVEKTPMFDLANSTHEKSISDCFAESPVLGFSEVPVNIDLVAPSEIVQPDVVESTHTPPPTPAVNQNAEAPQFICEPGNFEQVIEKLSVAEQGLVEDRNLSDTVENKAVPEPLGGLEVTNVPSEQEIIAPPAVSSPVGGGDIVAAAVAGATVAAAAAVAATGGKDVKQEKEAAVKKTGSASMVSKKPMAAKAKDSTTDKPKTAPKTASSRLTSASKTTKSPTSPVKSPVASKAQSRPSSSTLSKPPAAKAAPTRQPAKPSPSATATGSAVASSAASKTRPLTKPAVPKVGTARPKPIPPTIEKKPVTNGDIKTALKRPEQLATKTSTNRLTSRPATAPAAKTATKTVTKVSSSLTKSSPPLNGPSRPRPASSVPSRLVSKASTEKEVKESANKQISTRTTSMTTSTMRNVTTGLKSVTSPPRKIESKPLMNGKSPSKPSTLVKSTTNSKVPPKRPATATRLKSTKTSIVGKSETVQDSATVVTTNEVKSEVVLDNSQI